MSYREALETRGAEHADEKSVTSRIPFPNMAVLDHDGYDRIIVRIRAEIADGRVVYVHCWGGKGRTSTVVGCLLIDDGLDYDSAIARIAELRAGTRKAVDTVPGVSGLSIGYFGSAQPVVVDVEPNFSAAHHLYAHAVQVQKSGVRQHPRMSSHGGMSRVAGIPNNAL